MEYIYAAMLIHKAGKKIDEATLTAVLNAAGVKSDSARVKATVAALDGVNIEEAIAKAAVVAPVAAPSASGAHAGEAKKDEKKSAAEEKKSDESAAAGLGALFG